MTDSSAWNDSHRAFLQALIARGSLTFEEAQPVLASIQSAHEHKRIQPGDITEEDFDEYVSALSAAVAPFDYEIRATKHQVSKAKVFAIINAASDGLTQAATGFAADEIAFVKRVLDAMFTTFNTKRCEVCAVTATQALQLAKAARDGRGENTQTQVVNGGGAQTQTQGSGAAGITMANAEAVLMALVSQGWFELSRKGFYSLSPRALMELRAWLIQTYNENEDSEDEDPARYSGERIKMCPACKEIVTVGQRCADKSCPIRLHDMCTDRFFRMQQAERCPKCKKDWQEHGIVGEKAAQASSQRRSNGQAPNSTARSRPSGVNGVQDRDEEDD